MGRDDKFESTGSSPSSGGASPRLYGQRSIAADDVAPIPRRSAADSPERVPASTGRPASREPAPEIEDLSADVYGEVAAGDFSATEAVPDIMADDFFGADSHAENLHTRDLSAADTEAYGVPPDRRSAIASADRSSEPFQPPNQASGTIVPRAASRGRPVEGEPRHRESTARETGPENTEGSSGRRLRPEETVTREIYGTARNIEEFGAPSDYRQHERIRYFFFPTWRSQLFNIVGYFVCCAICVLVSSYVRATVVPGELIRIGSFTLYMHLPVLILLPGFMLGKILIAIYDAKYIIDDTGVEAQIGLVSLNLRQPRLRWEDIRGSEPQQTLWERILGIGSVLVGSAMTQDVEIVMSGVPNPRAIQLLIQRERDRRLQELRSMAGAGRDAKVATVFGD